MHIRKKDENSYVFLKDYIFNSPSGASNIILGRNSNGWTEWKTSAGKKLEEIYKR